MAKLSKNWGPLHPATAEPADRLARTSLGRGEQLELYRFMKLTRMTEDLGMAQGSEADRAALHPRWIAPIVTWLASASANDVTGRVFEASGQVFGIAEGWHRGPVTEPLDDPTKLGPVVAELLSRARRNAGMNGQDLD